MGNDIEKSLKGLYLAQSRLERQIAESTDPEEKARLEAELKELKSRLEDDHKVMFFTL